MVVSSLGWGGQVTGWGRSWSAGLSVGLGLTVSLIAACASPPAKIPFASPSPSEAATTIAPGVEASPSQLQLPPYTVSITNPLPAGISPTQVVTDVVVDNLIENAALEKGDPNLLADADTGDLLESEQQDLATSGSDRIKVLMVQDDISSVQLGSKGDPNDVSANIAAIVEGSETRQVRDAAGVVTSKTAQFDVLLWAVWAPTLNRYLLCDEAAS